MSRPLNKRNRRIAENQVKKAVRELYRQQIAFWVSIGRHSNIAKKLARSDVRCKVGAVLVVWCR